MDREIYIEHLSSSPVHLCPLWSLQGLCHQLQLLKQPPKQPNTVSVLVALHHPVLAREGESLAQDYTASHWQSWDLDLLGPKMMSPPVVSHCEAMGLSDDKVPVWHSQWGKCL